MIYKEQNESLEQMKEIYDLIKRVQVKASCDDKEAAQEKLDFWKETIHDELCEIREKTKAYCKGIEKTTDTRHEDLELFKEADSQRTILHNSLITALDIVVRNIKFNFSSRDYAPVIKARGLNPGAFLSGAEIEKIDFPNEALFLPEGIYNGAPLLNAEILKQPGNRVKITYWAMDVYNSLSAVE